MGFKSDALVLALLFGIVHSSTNLTLESTPVDFDSTVSLTKSSTLLSTVTPTANQSQALLPSPNNTTDDTNTSASHEPSPSPAPVPVGNSTDAIEISTTLSPSLSSASPASDDQSVSSTILSSTITIPPSSLLSSTMSSNISSPFTRAQSSTSSPSSSTTQSTVFSTRSFTSPTPDAQHTGSMSATSKIVIAVAATIGAVVLAVSATCIVKRWRRRNLASRYSTLADEFGVDEDINTPSYGYNQSDNDL